MRRLRGRNSSYKWFIGTPGGFSKTLAIGASGLLLIALLFEGVSPAIFTKTPQRRNAGFRVAENRYLRHLKYLSADELKGRKNGSKELDQAAEYIAQQFHDWGLQGSNEGGYFQEFDVPTGFRIGPENRVTFFESPDQALHLRFGVDYQPVSYQEDSPLQAVPLVFVGFGINAPELGYDDYAGLDVVQKIVVAYEHEPQEHSLDSPFGGPRLTPYSTIEYKAREARQRGALALVLLPDRFNHYRDPSRIPKADLEHLDLNVIQLSEEWAKRLMEVSGRDPRQIRRSINLALKPQSFTMGAIQAVVRIDVTVVREPVRNVVGVVPGETKRALVIGAHYDHLGLGGRYSLAPEATGEIHNGADDNASGVAALLELSRIFAQQRPHHTLVFVAFAGEELGLLGSRHYTEDPVIPLEDTVAMLNMDMIGRSRGDLLVGGVGTALEFRAILETLQQHSSLRFRYAETPRASSDHMSFSRRKIPVLFFFSGLHADYHRPGDDWNRIDLSRALEIVRVVRDCIDHLDRLSTDLTFVDLGRVEPPEN